MSFLLYSCPDGEVFFCDVIKTAEDDGLSCLFWVVCSEDEDALAAEEETIHVGKSYAGIAEHLDGVGGPARLVVKFQGKDIGEGDRNALFFQSLESSEWLTADDSIDAVFRCVGNGGRDDLHAEATEEVEHFYKRPGLVLNEYGQLMDGHGMEMLVRRVFANLSP